MNFLKILVVFVCGTFAINVAADESALKSFINKLDSLNAMQAQFVQTTRDQHNNALQELTGTLLVAKPGKMRWQTEPPYSQLVVSDNQSVWFYDEDLEQVTIRDMEQRIQETPALLLSGNTDEIKQNFDITYQSNGQFSRYSLAPKDSSQLFEKIEFQYYDNTLESMRIYDATGQVTEIVFTEIDLAPQIDESTFQFKAPNGVDVIDARNAH